MHNNGRGATGGRRLLAEPLERRDLLSGVTLITHGFDGNADDWVTAAAQAISERPDLSMDQALYRMEVTDPGHDNGPLSVTSTWLSGPSPVDAETQAPEIAIVLDWSDVAGILDWNTYTRSTFDVAVAVAEKLLEPGFLAGWTQPLASLPLHFIGHSRGGSLVGELAHQLGLRGIWVDQVTTLDPHPVDGVNDPLDLDFGDSPMVAWGNVVYWDNYWRANADLFDFTGEPIENVQDVHLSDAVFGNGGYAYGHSDTHLWYYGTIDTSEVPPANDGVVDVPNNWYGGENPGRLASGYSYSRLVGNVREPAGLTAAFSNGLAVREPVNPTMSAWPNVLGVEVTSTGKTFVDGASIPVDCYWQDADSSSTITFALDVDKNPFNANHQNVRQDVVPSAATLQFNSVLLSTGDVLTGTYYVLATIEDEVGQIRYAYAPSAVVVENPSANLPPTDILLDTVYALERVAGYYVGHLTVVDQNVLDSHTFIVSDERFEVVDATLKLKAGQSLSSAVESSVALDVTAIDKGQLALSPPKHFAIAVTPNPLPWHNSAKPLDVSGDAYVSALDALVIINELNERMFASPAGLLPEVRSADSAGRVDVNADGNVSPVDALLVINYLNQGGEGEASLHVASGFSGTPVNESWTPDVKPASLWSTAAPTSTRLFEDYRTATAGRTEQDAWRDLDAKAARAWSGMLSRPDADEVFESVGNGESVLDCGIEAILDVLAQSGVVATPRLPFTTLTKIHT